MAIGNVFPKHLRMGTIMTCDIETKARRKKGIWNKAPVAGKRASWRPNCSSGLLSLRDLYFSKQQMNYLTNPTYMPSTTTWGDARLAKFVFPAQEFKY